MTRPCRIYNKNVNDNDDAIQCDIGNFWVHIKCNNINDMHYEYLEGNNEP